MFLRASRQSSSLQRPQGGARTPSPQPELARPPLGNHALQRLLRSGSVQAKLTVNQPGDRFEQEADRVADEILRAPAPAALEPRLSSPVQAPRLQRKCATCQEEEERGGPENVLQRKCVTCEKNEADVVQAKPLAAAWPASPSATTSVLPEPGTGQRLSESVRAFFETRFGQDFRHVRVHTDDSAAESAQALSALAYTIGPHIVFGRGQYQPEAGYGRRLLAHELTHTMQHARGSSRNLVMRRWDPAGSDCAAEPTTKWIRTVVVEQETPQSITLHWSDGSLDSDECSTGKGHCCVSGAGEETPCPTARSRQNDTNCTAISDGAGFPVVNRYRGRNGWNFWTDIVPERGIGMHQYPVVDGTPLSHGCVRLHEPMARKIYCGVHQNQTRVQVRGFARPQCSSPALQQEWQADFDYARTPTDGESVGVRRGVADTRQMLRQTFSVNEAGLTTLLSTSNTQILSQLPRCSTTAPRPTTEERRLYEDTGQQGAVPTQILAASGFDQTLTPFLISLSQATSFALARSAIRQHGHALWQKATEAAQQSTGADTDDRPLYWARLEMARALRQWQPGFTLSATQRQTLIDLLEQTSRGKDTAQFKVASGVKRVLISGFDPFGLDTGIRRGNPSGAAVLALDGKSIQSGSTKGQIQGVIFPVRFSDFNAGSVESFFGPYFSRPSPVDMIMTISQGDREYEVEEFAGRNRSSDPFLDNLREAGGGTDTSPAPPPGLAAGPEFLSTTLPASAIRGALGRTTPLAVETERSELRPRATTALPVPSGGPTPGAVSVTGSGGGFLSNEIFYRTALLRRSTGATIPYGHLHTPALALPASGITTAGFSAARDTIVSRVQQILEASLPAL